MEFAFGTKTQLEFISFPTMIGSRIPKLSDALLSHLVFYLILLLATALGVKGSFVTACSDNGKTSKIQLLEIETDCRGPIQLWKQWYDEARTIKENKLPEAMSMSTVQKNGRPAARTLLLRGYDEQGFKIYTDYTSPKAIELENNAWTALVFLWYYVPKGKINATGTRQVRVEGHCTKLEMAENREYFESEPDDAQVRAVVQRQSVCIGAWRRKEILKQTQKLLALAQCPGYKIPFPINWGGYRINPEMMEFYQSEPDAIGDRIRFIKRKDAKKEGKFCQTYDTDDHNWVYHHLDI